MSHVINTADSIAPDLHTYLGSPESYTMRTWHVTNVIRGRIRVTVNKKLVNYYEFLTEYKYEKKTDVQNRIEVDRIKR